MVGRIEERLRENIEEMLLAIVQRDVTMLTGLIKRVGEAPPNLDERALSVDVADFLGEYANQPLEKFDLSGALSEVTEIVHRYQISLPAQVALLLKTLITLEGTTKMLSPSFSLLELLQPLHRKMLLRRLSPQRQLRKFMRFYLEAERLAEIPAAPAYGDSGTGAGRQVRRTPGSSGPGTLRSTVWSSAC